MNKNSEAKDSSITFERKEHKYGVKMFFPKEIVNRPDTSTSIVVNWRFKENVHL